MNAEHARFILQQQELSWMIDGRRKGCSMLQTKDKMKRNVRGGEELMTHQRWKRLQERDEEKRV